MPTASMLQLSDFTCAGLLLPSNSQITTPNMPIIQSLCVLAQHCCCCCLCFCCCCCCCADLLVEQICSYLVPIDLALVKLYSLVMVAFATLVLVKWCVVGL
jgi:hypothetical protein